MTPPELGPLELSGAAVLLGATIGLSAWQRLELGRTILVAGLRTTVQLLAIGFLLAAVFSWRSPFAIAAILMAMSIVAGHAAASKQAGVRRVLSPWLLSGALFSSAIATLLYVGGLLRLAPDRPDLWIPLGGFILGNSMAASAVAAERFLAAGRQRRDEVECLLSLGAPAKEALRPITREAFRAGLIPRLSAMMVMGIVKLPGIMTGQMLAGQEASQAAMYQILVMFTLLFSDTIAIALTMRLLFRRVVTPAEQLRHDLLRGPP